MSERGEWQHYNHSLISSYLHPDWISNLQDFQKLLSTSNHLTPKGERCDFKPAACVGGRQQAADRRKKASAKSGASCYSCYCSASCYSCYCGASCYCCYCGGAASCHCGEGATVPASHTYNHTSLPAPTQYFHLPTFALLPIFFNIGVEIIFLPHR